MAAIGNYVKIKGKKDGLFFHLDDQCDFSDLLQELRHKLETTHQKILSGPIAHVHVRLGKRRITDEQKDEILQVIASRGNLIVKSIISDEDHLNNGSRKLRIYKGMVRSGQTLIFDGSVLFIGDVNPGGSVICTGDIYVMGSLRGMAHAGSNGDEQAVIIASHMRPTQLRIANVISRPPDEWDLEADAYMEFAYLEQGKMEIDKLIHLHRIRPGAIDFKRERW